MIRLPVPIETNDLEFPGAIPFTDGSPAMMYECLGYYWSTEDDGRVVEDGWVVFDKDGITIETDSGFQKHMALDEWVTKSILEKMSVIDVIQVAGKLK